MQSHPQYVNSSVNRYHLIFDFQEHMLHAESRHLGMRFHALGKIGMLQHLVLCAYRLNLTSLCDECFQFLCL